MERLEVSGAVRQLQLTLGVKRLIHKVFLKLASLVNGHTSQLTTDKLAEGNRDICFRPTATSIVGTLLITALFTFVYIQLTEGNKFHLNNRNL